MIELAFVHLLTACCQNALSMRNSILFLALITFVRVQERLSMRIFLVIIVLRLSCTAYGDLWDTSFVRTCLICFLIMQGQCSRSLLIKIVRIVLLVSFCNSCKMVDVRQDAKMKSDVPGS